MNTLVEYAVFIGDFLKKQAEIAEGKPVVLEVRDQQYARHLVKGLITSEELPESHILWIEGWNGCRETSPKWLKVLEALA